MNIVERVVAHKLQTHALDEAAAEDEQRATQRLRAAATRLLELGEMEMAQQAELQALEAAFDKADAAIMAQEQQHQRLQNAQSLQIEQLNEIGKKLDELLHQFVDNTQNQKEL